MVLRTVKTPAGSKVKFTSTIRTEYQTGEHSLPLCLCRAAFVRSQLLYPFKDSFFSDCFMCIAENCLLFLCGGRSMKHRLTIWCRKNVFWTVCSVLSVLKKLSAQALSFRGPVSHAMINRFAIDAGYLIDHNKGYAKNRWQLSDFSMILWMQLAVDTLNGADW